MVLAEHPALYIGATCDGLNCGHVGARTGSGTTPLQEVAFGCDESVGEKTVKWFGRNTLVPSGWWNPTGLVTSSGYVRRRDACSAASTTIAAMTPR